MPRASCKESVPCRPTRPSSSSTGCRRPSASGWGGGGSRRWSASSPTSPGSRAARRCPTPSSCARTGCSCRPRSIHQTIAGDYVDMDIVNQWNESDMVLRPDYAAATASPWADDVTLQVIHNVEDLSGRPIEVAPRNVLKRVVGLYEKEGWRPVVAPEMEFYLIKPNLNPNEPIEPPVGRTGRQMVIAPGLLDERGRRVRQGDRRHLRLRRGAGVRDRHHHPGGRRRAGGDQLPARRPGGAGRPGLLLQAHDPRGGAQEQLLRHLHGQADAGGAGLAPCTSTSRWWT